MYTQFVEVTDKVAYGKFMVARLDFHELNTQSHMPEVAGLGQRLLTYGGRRRMNDHSTLVIDLQRGTAAAWPLQGIMQAYMNEHLKELPNLVCPMYLPFVHWLYEQGTWAMGAGSVGDIPRYIELPFGYPQTRVAS